LRGKNTEVYMSIDLLLEELEKINDLEISAALINQFVAYRGNYQNPSFILLFNNYRQNIAHCITGMAEHQRENLTQIFEAMSLYCAHYFEPRYKEHVLQKYVVENAPYGIKIGLELGVDINTTTGYLPDLSYSEIRLGFVQLASFELPKAWYTNWHRCTPLVLASLLGHMDVVKFLVVSGARLNMETRHHNTALDWATKREHHQIERFLIEQGALRNTTSDQGIDVLAGVEV